MRVPELPASIITAKSTVSAEYFVQNRKTKTQHNNAHPRNSKGRRLNNVLFILITFKDSRLAERVN
jgi:hypothetical protein